MVRSEPAGRAAFEERYHRNERVSMFSDGVFAIVVTLLVLELKVPPLHDPASPRELFAAVSDMQGELFSFVLSFLFVVNLWVSHNLFFRVLERVDTTLLWINNLFLLLVCVVPFPTAVIGAYPENPAAVLLFGINWLLIAPVLFFMGRYAIHRKLLTPHLDQRRFRKIVQVLGLLLPLSLVPMALAYVSPMLALSLYVLMAVVGCVLSFLVRLGTD